MENEVNILAEEKPKSIKLADGKEYKLPPIDMTTLANMQQTIGFKLSAVKGKLEDDPVIVLRQILFALLKEDQPELDIDKVGHLITIKEMKAISSTISEIMALT